MPNTLKHGPLEKRFWYGVQVTEGCWEWQRYVCPSTGYGRIAAADGYTKTGTHRVSWELHNGPIPDGMFVCHTCDNRKCVRPDHLFLGTPGDNVRDMRAKGRGSDPPRPAPGRSDDEVREANKIRMGQIRTKCKRGHDLPPYQPGTKRVCLEPECRNARRKTLGNPSQSKEK